MHSCQYGARRPRIKLFVVLRALRVSVVNYLLKKSVTACFITSRSTSEIDRVSGMSLGHISTQFCEYPHSWMPPSPISACKRSCLIIFPVGCMLNSLTCEIAAAPTNPVLSLNCGHTSMQQVHEMQRDS